MNSASRPCSTASCSKVPGSVDCRECSLDPLCSRLDYAGSGSGVPNGILLRRRSVARGETIFRQEDPFHSLFAVASGSFKTFIPRAEQLDQVIGFHLPGELIGADALAGGG